VPKILVADDDENIRLLYAWELNEAGYDVVTAKGGRNLLKMIKEKRPDLVVLAIKMTDCNGLDLLQEIRDQFCNLPVILSTVCDHLRYDIRSAAANFFVVKSCDLTELKGKIALALEAGHAGCRPDSEGMARALSNAHR